MVVLEFFWTIQIKCQDDCSGLVIVYSLIHYVNSSYYIVIDFPSVFLREKVKNQIDSCLRKQYI